MDARKVLGVSEKDTIYTVDKPYMSIVKLYGEVLTSAPYAVHKIIDLLKRAADANEALGWESWLKALEVEEPGEDWSGKPDKETLLKWLLEYKYKSELSFIENEPDREFRDKYFHGLDRVLWLVGANREIDLGDISEHDIDARIRQGYIAEWNGDKDRAEAIYHSVGFTERL